MTFRIKFERLVLVLLHLSNKDVKVPWRASWCTESKFECVNGKKKHICVYFLCVLCVLHVINAFIFTYQHLLVVSPGIMVGFMSVFRQI